MPTPTRTPTSTATPRRRARRASLALALAGLVPAACGGDDSTESADRLAASGTDDTSALEVIAQDTDFDRDRYELAAGQSTIEYVQEGALPHTLVIERDGADIDGFELEVGGSDSDSGSVELQPGTYTLYCDVAGHREAGMEAELVVE